MTPAQAAFWLKAGKSWADCSSCGRHVYRAVDGAFCRKHFPPTMAAT